MSHVLLTLDTTPPRLTAEAPATLREQAVEVEVVADEPLSSLVAWFEGHDAHPLPVEDNTLVVSSLGLPAGAALVLRVLAMDLVGNATLLSREVQVDGVSTLRVAVDVVPPIRATMSEDIMNIEIEPHPPATVQMVHDRMVQMDLDVARPINIRMEVQDG